MLDCSELIAEMCQAFHAQLARLCYHSFERAVEYKQVACALNRGCC